MGFFILLRFSFSIWAILILKNLAILRNKNQVYTNCGYLLAVFSFQQVNQNSLFYAKMELLRFKKEMR